MSQYNPTERREMGDELSDNEAMRALIYTLDWGTRYMRAGRLNQTEVLKALESEWDEWISKFKLTAQEERREK